MVAALTRAGASDYTVPESGDPNCMLLSATDVIEREAARLRAELSVHNHSGIVMWTVGNEASLPLAF